MSYWTSRDFQEPIERGNASVDLPRFQMVYEGRGYHLKIKCNIGGLLAAADVVTVSIHSENKDEFLRQVRMFNFSTAKEILLLWNIIERSCDNLLSEEEQLELDHKILSSDIEKLPINSFYFDIRALARAARHLEVEACGGAVNGELTISDPYSNGVVYSGYYSFRYNYFHEKESNIKMMKALSEWTGENGEKEDIILKLFSQK